MCGPDSTHKGAPTLKQRFFVITITKTKRFFMGAFVGALFVRNPYKTNNKQRISRGYDSESGTTIKRTRPQGGFLLWSISKIIPIK